MSYQVIARKYRPQRFGDVVGQQHVTHTLANAIQQNRIAHAYLFAGPRGTGKTTIARIFAKCLNCTGGPKAEFDDQDPRALEIAEGRSIDVLEIDGASNRGIEEIRELRETVKYAPASSKFKIYIIDEVHMLTKEAFNALLKTLEEPPAHVKFMFATTEPEKVLPTILSRCQRFDLRRIPVKLIVEHLARIAKQEKVKIDNDALHAIARGAEGGMRDAESALDQLISFCGDKIEEADVLSMFGLAAQSQILALASAVLDGQAETALRELDTLAAHGKDLGRLLADLLHYFRNLLLYQVSRGDLTLLEVAESEAATLETHSATVSRETLTRIMEILAESEFRLRESASKKIMFEVVLLKIIEARNAVSLDAVLKQLHQLRGDSGDPPAATPGGTRSTASPVSSETKSGTARNPASSGAAAVAPPPAPASAGTVAAVDPALEQLWTRVLESVGKVSQFTRSYLIEAFPIALANDVLTVGFDPEFADQLQLVDNAKTHTLLQTKLQELGRPGVQVKLIQAERPAGRHRAPPAPSPPAAATPTERAAAPRPSSSAAPARARGKPEPMALNQEDFKNDPLIQKALEVFKGQIVEVRA